MLPLRIPTGQGLSVLAVGAHCDDVEIGAGGTLLRLAAEVPGLRVHVVVLTSTPQRAAEAEASAAAFVTPVEPVVEIHALPDGRLPVAWGQAKEVLEDVASRVRPDLVLGPHPSDAHQDHRVVAEILPTVLRDHLLMQYEIPKWDGDLGAGRPSVYVPLPDDVMARKSALLLEHFGSQSGRDWFEAATFEALGRLRGLECRHRYAEAFTVPKSVVALGDH